MSKKNNTTLPSDLLESRPELIETQYGILKGIFGAIPFLGTMMNEVLFDIQSRTYQARLNNTVELLTEKLNHLENSPFNKKYLSSDDFHDFTLLLIESSLKIQSEKKRNALSNIYIECCRTQVKFNESIKPLFMKFTVDIREHQIEILSFIQKNKENLRWSRIS